MKALLLLAALLSAGSVYANELDNEQTNINQRALALPKTVVVRVNTLDQSVAVLHSDAALNAADAEMVTKEHFAPVAVDAKPELDKDSSKSGWYFYFNYYNWAYPTYYYYNYNYTYTNYYWYNYGYYNYYYYRWYY